MLSASHKRETLNRKGDKKYANYNVLLYDEEDIIRRVVELALLSLDDNYRLTMARDRDDADAALLSSDLIIANYPPGEIGAPAILKITRELNLLTPVMIYSANYDPSLVIESFRAGAADYLLKPCSVNELADRLNNCLCAVFRNLLTNAIKHGGKGCTIGFNMQKWKDCYRISVFNSGPEIPENDRHRLFSIAAGRAAQTIPNNGAGVGLYLTKRIIAGFGGDLWYESVEDNPHFVFTLPYSVETVLQ